MRLDPSKPILSSPVQVALVRMRALVLRNTLDVGVRLLRGEHVWPGELPKKRLPENFQPLPTMSSRAGRMNYVWPEMDPQGSL